MDVSALDKSISALENALSALEKSSESLDFWLKVWTALVVIGVAIEIFVVITEHVVGYKAWRRATIRSPEKPGIWFFVLQLVGPVLVTAGVAGELWVGAMSASVNTELRNRTRVLVGLIQQENLRLRAQIEPRRLTGVQRATLRQALESLPTPIGVAFNPLNKESTDFADDFASAFSEARWPSVRRVWGGFKYGVFIASVDTNASDSPQVKLLSAALTAIEVPHEITANIYLTNTAKGVKIKVWKAPTNPKA